MTAATQAPAQTVIGHWIGDEELQSRQQFEVCDPSRGEVYALASEGGADEIDRAVRVAQDAYAHHWSGLGAVERSDLLQQVAEKLRGILAPIAEVESIDTGKPIAFVQGREVPAIPGELSFYAGAARAWRDGLHSGSTSGLGLTVRQPYGVVGLIIPYNAPMMVMAEKVSQALAAGNCVVIKPSPLAPASSVLLARLLTEAGLPPGVVNVVQGSGDTAGRALCEHPAVPRISFTGSTKVGTTVLRSGSDRLKRVTLELSGKNSCLVFADADLDAACRNALYSAFANAGQLCTSGSRILVEQSVMAEFCDRFVDAASRLRVGRATDPETQVGPVISGAHRDSLNDMIALGKSDLEVLYAGAVPEGLPGFHVAPHVFKAVDPQHRLAREELFGPITCVTDFKDDDEAVDIANSTEYGLSSFVWTTDLRRVVRMTRALESGRVWVNTGHTIPPDMSLPPWKMSGIGEEGGLEGLGSFTRTKTCNLSVGDRVPGF